MRKYFKTNILCPRLHEVQLVSLQMYQTIFAQQEHDSRIKWGAFIWMKCDPQRVYGILTEIKVVPLRFSTFLIIDEPLALVALSAFSCWVHCTQRFGRSCHVKAHGLHCVQAGSEVVPGGQLLLSYATERFWPCASLRSTCITKVRKKKCKESINYSRRHVSHGSTCFVRGHKPFGQRVQQLVCLVYFHLVGSCRHGQIRQPLNQPTE